MLITITKCPCTFNTQPTKNSELVDYTMWHFLLTIVAIPPAVPNDLDDVIQVP